jgi:hypothetical protein
MILLCPHRRLEVHIYELNYSILSTGIDTDTGNILTGMANGGTSLKIRCLAHGVRLLALTLGGGQGEKLPEVKTSAFLPSRNISAML